VGQPYNYTITAMLRNCFTLFDIWAFDENNLNIKHYLHGTCKFMLPLLEEHNYFNCLNFTLKCIDFVSNCIICAAKHTPDNVN
jgi:hypothetical protein